LVQKKNKFYVRDLNTGEIIWTCNNDYVSIEIENNLVVSVDKDGEIKFWEISTGNCLKSLSLPRILLGDKVENFSLHMGCKLLVRYDQTCQVWDWSTGKYCYTVENVEGSWVYDCANFFVVINDSKVNLYGA